MTPSSSSDREQIEVAAETADRFEHFRDLGESADDALSRALDEAGAWDSRVSPE